MSHKTHSRAVRRRNYAPIFSALGDETRLALVARLSEGQPRSITELTEGTKVSRQAITKHLRVLKDVRMVRSVRSGRERLYELDPAPIQQVREYADIVSAHWDRALLRLKNLVED